MPTRFRDALADTFFEKELDEAFTHGIKEGRRNVANHMLFELRNSAPKMTPAKLQGYQVALRMVEEIQRKYR